MNKESINVLFVDDEENILNALKRELFNQPYNMFFAKNGNEALKILKENEIAVIITDLNMPEINGLELLYSVKQNYPDTVRIILSAFTDINIVFEAIKTGETHRFISKPWNLEEELIPIINQSIKLYQTFKDNQRLFEQLKLKEKELNEIRNNYQNALKKINELERENKELKKEN
jgi:response regulator RpfG family c-di-GMP phosphodiesterase